LRPLPPGSLAQTADEVSELVLRHGDPLAAIELPEAAACGLPEHLEPSLLLALLPLRQTQADTDEW
jgi:hypothetical protein